MELSSKYEKYFLVKRYLVKVLGLGLSLFIIFTIIRGQFSYGVQRSTVLMLGSIMIFLSPQNKTYPKLRTFWLNEVINWLSIIAIVGCTLYIYVEWFTMVEYRYGAPNLEDLVLFIVTILIVFEITYRTSGVIIPVVCLLFVTYLLFGQCLPGILHHPNIRIMEIIEGSFGTRGIYGIVLSALINIIYIFIIFGAFLRVSGAGDVFVKLAYTLLGRFPGGPAQTAVLASALFGSISGSGPANVIATGNFTIPLMKKVGYKPSQAAAVEACSSTVGQIMPPVMGVSAFIMSQIIGVPYLRICSASVLPAILFSFSLLVLVYLEAKKSQIPIIPREEIPVVDISFIRKTAILLFSVGTLVFMLFKGSSPAFSCLFGIIALIIGSFFDKTMRMTPKKILKALIQGAQDGLLLLAICALIGIVVNAVNSTGIGLLFSQIIIEVVENSLPGALVITMIAAIILGMGLPTVPAYLMVVLVAGRALAALGIPLLLAHLFCLYYAVLGTITPPVCLSAYTAASIAKSNPMKTGFTAWRFGLVGFIIPFIMVYNPELGFFTGSYFTTLVTFLLSAVGVFAFVAFERGFLLQRCGLPSRIFLLLIAIALFYPLYWMKIIGLGGMIIMIYLQVISKQKKEGKIK